jgi:hypothetical protein
MTDEEEDEMLEGMSASEIEALGLSLGDSLGDGPGSRPREGSFAPARYPLRSHAMAPSRPSDTTFASARVPVMPLASRQPVASRQPAATSPRLAGP